MPDKMIVIKGFHPYYFPEIREAAEEFLTHYPHEFFLFKKQSSSSELADRGRRKLSRFYKKYLPDLGAFTQQYFLASRGEGMREYLSRLQLEGNRRLYALRGEDELYAEMAASRGLRLVEVDLEKTRPDQLRPGHWLISNPSARDGNLLPDRLLREIAAAGHKIFYDLTWATICRPHRFDLTLPSIEAVLLSLRFSLGAPLSPLDILFTREPLPGLAEAKGERNIVSLLFAARIFDQVKLSALYKKYRPLQQALIAEANRQWDLSLRASDVLLFAYLPRQEADRLSREQRKILFPALRPGGCCRFCLTPSFEAKESLLPQRQRPLRPPRHPGKKGGKRERKKRRRY